MKQRPLCPPQSERGFTLIEMIIAFLTVFTGAAAAMNMYQFTNTRNHSVEIKKALGTVGDMAKKDLLGDLAKNWTLLADNNCDGSNANVQMSVRSINNTEFTAELLTQSNLDTVLPSQLSNQKPNPLRLAISQLIGAYGDKAGQMCSDNTILSQPTYSVIGSSTRNQLLCRCAAAATPYGTLQPKLLNASNHTGLYACLLFTPTPTGTVSQIGKSMSNSYVVMEANYSVFDIPNATSYKCSESTTALNTPVKIARSTGRLFYGLYPIDPKTDKDTDLFVNGSFVAE